MGPRVTWAGVFHLCVIYLVWGSTYLGIRVAVLGGFPPFVLGALRVLVAGGLLLLWAGLRRHRVLISWEEARILAIPGLLLWVGANGLVMWAEQRAASGYAALLAALAPIWAALLEAVLDRRPPSGLTVLALLTGFCGVGILSLPERAAAQAGDRLSTIALLLAGLCWAAGSVFQQRRRAQVASVVSSGYQQVFAGLGFVVAVVATRESLPHVSPSAWAAWAYLVVFGSLLAYTSYVQVLRLLPMSIATTSNYVNPAVAVFLGRLVLGESVTAWTLLGAGLVLLGVAGVFHDRVRYRESPQPRASVETNERGRNLADSQRRRRLR
jgi:drug/metabolite transporter (DMT)-like permease